MDNPPYSPNLALTDFWLLPKLKNVLKGKRFLDAQRNRITEELLEKSPRQRIQK
jgi:hypothetical protein